MEPAGVRQPEFVPLPENKHEFTGEARGAPRVQYTTVTINRTVTPPKDYIVWSILSLVYFNPFCLGLAALCYSVKARDRKVAGDLEGSRKYGSKAWWFNVVALILGLILIIVVIVQYVKFIYRIQQMQQTVIHIG